MAIDIKAIDTEKLVNSLNMICSTTPTGYTSKKNISEDIPNENKIENIESKFTDKFDDPVYYFDHPNEGDSISGDVLGV